jgi:hypothetical protein
MTVQTKHFIELADIVALRCECKNPECQTALLLRLAGDANDSLRLCPKCKRPWALFGEASFEPEIKKFFAVLESLKAVAGKLGFSMTLEIKEVPLGTLAKPERLT